MPSHETPANWGEQIRGLRSRLSALERQALGTAQAELDANRSAAWQAPTLVNSFSNFGSGYAPAAYYKDTFGRVYLRGMLNVPVSAVYGGAMFTLASGYRPAYIHEFTLVSGSAEGLPVYAVAVVSPSGTVVLNFDQVTAVPLDVIQFRTF